jgi:hypothetical protein
MKKLHPCFVPYFGLDKVYFTSTKFNPNPNNPKINFVLYYL